MDNEKYSWEEPYIMNDKTEPIQSFEAFKLWVEMGNKRSLKAVAERMEKSHDTIKKYSCTWKWSERLQDKLSYENKVVYGKQLETILPGLEVDSKRDVTLQIILGNIVDDIFELSIEKASNLLPRTNPKTMKMIDSTNLVLLERLVKVYSHLEKIHKDNQQKIIDYNHKSLSVQSFNNTDDYKNLIKNGKDEYNKIIKDHLDSIEKVKNVNFGGYSYIKSDMFKSHVQQNNLPELENKEEHTEQLPEPEPEPKAKPKRKKKKSTTRSNKKKKTSRRTKNRRKKQS